MENNQEILFRLSMFEQQLQAVSRGIVDLESLHLGMDEISGSIDKEIFAQIGKGIYVKAKIVSEELNVNIGDNNFVNKSIPETKELIMEQIKRLKDVEIELERNIEITNNEFLEMIEEYRKIEKTEE
jgi:prefoldin subunit 5